ncbi:glycosyltransferase [Novosphingobium sp. FSY-8]|uniref:Glycosyltransferase n=1 Tax=Novosphingobium ovatum TaxID=1908523 RepID=A0ABW9XGP3_9SPHN|nr:glycosyltransferase [Novosphingobium ovatum]NBC37643.1 glycosyltransferase [Novosphingobium ovatum]
MSAATPRFSILIPVYNAAGFIEATLLSIAKQNFPGVEIILMDGGSNDGTLDIARAYPGLDIKITSEPDKGQLHALQKATQKATGEICYWLNADDILMPGSLAEVDKAFRDDPTLDLVFSDDFAFYEERQLLVNGGLIKGMTFADHSLYYRQMYSECVFWKREKTVLLPESFYDLRLYTDYAFFLNLRIGLKEKWLPKRLGAFRSVAGQISQTYQDRRRTEPPRIKAHCFERQGWSPQSIALRRALHGPSFFLRQWLRPAIHAALRAAGRKLDGGASRAAKNDAFFNDWLNPQKPVTPALIQLLYR